MVGLPNIWRDVDFAIRVNRRLHDILLPLLRRSAKSLIEGFLRGFCCRVAGQPLILGGLLGQVQHLTEASLRRSLERSAVDRRAFTSQIFQVLLCLYPS